LGEIYIISIFGKIEIHFQGYARIRNCTTLAVAVFVAVGAGSFAAAASPRAAAIMLRRPR